MGFLKRIFGTRPENPHETLTKEKPASIGEFDKCPHCMRTLNKIPKRKSKCPHCKEYIYSRTRPLDKKKVLVTEEQKDAIELEWTRFYEAREQAELMENDDYATAKKELAQRFGKEPSINDVKWRVYNQKTLDLAVQRQWGLYRNNKLDMAKLLQKEGKNKQALSLFLEICYLDLNGCRNIGIVNGKPMSKQECETIGAKDFDSSIAFLAPGIISMLKDEIKNLGLTMNQVKQMFIEENKRTKPLKIMPLTPEDAWGLLRKKLDEEE